MSEKHSLWFLSKTLFRQHRVISWIVVVLSVFFCIATVHRTFNKWNDTFAIPKTTTLQPQSPDAKTLEATPSQTPISMEKSQRLAKVYQESIKDISVIEMISGLLGIFIGIFITLVIEKNNSIKDEQLSAATENIKNTSTNILDRTIAILEESKKVKILKTYEEVLKEIHDIIQLSEKNQQDLLIMNPTASFGYMLSFDLDTILKHRKLVAESNYPFAEKINVLRKFRMNQYYTWFRKVAEIQKKNDGLFFDCAAKSIESSESTNYRFNISYATLRADSDVNDSPFATSFLNKSLENSFLVPYTNKENKLFGDLAILNAPTSVNTTKAYVVPSNLHKEYDIQDLDGFKVFLNKDQQWKIDKLVDRGAGVIKVRLMESIPLQIFISKPSGIQNEGRCLIMFINEHTIGKTKNLTAFSSNDGEIIETFTTIFHSIASNGRLVS